MDIFQISRSGLAAAQTAQQVAANNIANVNTDGFKASGVAQEERRPAGVAVADVYTSSSPGPVYETYRPVSRGNGATDVRPVQVEGSNVELSREMPQMIVNQRAFEASVAAFKTGDEMLGTLLSLKA